MANQAKYTVMIPTHDNLGQQLGDIPTAAHHWLFYHPKVKVQGSYIQGPMKGNWRDDPQETFHHLVTYADDTPEMDSTIKQLAHHVADVANQWGVFVAKEGGKQGIQSWVIDNPNYRHGEGADAAVLDKGMGEVTAALFGRATSLEHIASSFPTY
jgi:hypothetical protein